MYYKMFIPNCFPSLANFFTSNLHISKIIGNFVILTPSRGNFWLLCAIFLSLRLHKKMLDTVQWLKCIIKCLYQLVFKFGQFLDFKLTYLSYYWRFCDFDPSKGHFWLSCAIFLSLRLKKWTLTLLGLTLGQIDPGYG